MGPYRCLRIRCCTSSDVEHNNAVGCVAFDGQYARIGVCYKGTGIAVALHCCKAMLKINRKMGNWTPCKIVTPENIILKLRTRDYVGEITRHANFGFNRYSGSLLIPK